MREGRKYGEGRKGDKKIKKDFLHVSEQERIRTGD